MFAQLQYPRPQERPAGDGRRGALHLVRAPEGSMQVPSDEQLMQRVVERDHEAFSLLVARHLGRSVKLAQNILGVAADADEAGQEIFVRLWERPGLFDASKAKFTTWLHRVVVNHCIDRRRGPRFEPLDAVMEHASSDPAPLEHLHAAHSARAVGDALKVLPVRQRTALALFYMQGMAQREAASCMDLTDSAFESLLQRARTALAAALKSWRPFPEDSHDTR